MSDYQINNTDGFWHVGHCSMLYERVLKEALRALKYCQNWGQVPIKQFHIPAPNRFNLLFLIIEHHEVISLYQVQ